jgi:hypothetical protein
MQGKNRKKIGEHKRYWLFCPTCPSVRESPAKRKTSKCTKCSRKSRKKKVDYIYFDLMEMKMVVPTRYFRICKHCGDSKRVKQASAGGLKSCNKCRHLGKEKNPPKVFYRICKHCGDEKKVLQKHSAERTSCTACKHLDSDLKAADLKRKETMLQRGVKCGRKLGVKAVKEYRTKVNRREVSKVAIEKARAINKAHREAVKEKSRAKPTPIGKTDEEMMAEYLKSNTVVCADTIVIDYGNEVKIKGY